MYWKQMPSRDQITYIWENLFPSVHRTVHNDGPVIMYYTNWPNGRFRLKKTSFQHITLRLLLYINVIFAFFWLLKLTWLLPALFFTKWRQILLWTGGKVPYFKISVWHNQWLIKKIYKKFMYHSGKIKRLTHPKCVMRDMHVLAAKY